MIIGAVTAIVMIVLTVIVMVVTLFLVANVIAARFIYGLGFMAMYRKDMGRGSWVNRDKKKKTMEMRKLTKVAIERASWDEEYINEHGAAQRIKDKMFLMVTDILTEWTAPGLLFPQAISNLLSHKLPTKGSMFSATPDEEGACRTGDKFKDHKYRTSLVAGLAGGSLAAMDPDTGFWGCILTGVLTAVAVPAVIRIVELLVSVRLAVLAGLTHRAVVIREYPCTRERRKIDPEEIAFLKLALSQYESSDMAACADDNRSMAFSTYEFTVRGTNGIRAAYEKGVMQGCLAELLAGEYMGKPLRYGEFRNYLEGKSLDGAEACFLTDEETQRQIRLEKEYMEKKLLKVCNGKGTGFWEYRNVLEFTTYAPGSGNDCGGDTLWHQGDECISWSKIEERCSMFGAVMASAFIDENAVTETSKKGILRKATDINELKARLQEKISIGEYEDEDWSVRRDRGDEVKNLTDNERDIYEEMKKLELGRMVLLKLCQEYHDDMLYIRLGARKFKANGKARGSWWKQSMAESFAFNTARFM